MVGLHHRDHVGGVRGQRVDRHRQDHAAHLDAGVGLVRDLGRQRRGDQLVVHRLEELGLGQLILGGADAARHERHVDHRVDLVERQPVLHLGGVPVEQHPHVALVEPDHLATDPAVVRLGQVQRRLVVGDRHEGFDAVLVALVEHAVVEREALLVRLRVVPVREDPAPRDGQPEHREAHLGEQRDVLDVPVVEVDRDQLEVVRGRLRGARCHHPVRRDVLDRQSLAALVEPSLELVGSRGATPEEAFRECPRLDVRHRASPSRAVHVDGRDRARGRSVVDAPTTDRLVVSRRGRAPARCSGRPRSRPGRRRRTRRCSSRSSR